MAQRLLRIITPQAIDPRLSYSAITFVLGNANFITTLNSIHFLKKGTPSATEVKLLSFLLDEKGCFNHKLWQELSQEKRYNSSWSNDSVSSLSQEPAIFSTLSSFEQSLERFSSHVETMVKKVVHRVEQLNSVWSQRLDKISTRFHKSRWTDRLGGKSVWEVIESFFAHLDQAEYVTHLQEAFLSQFAKVHPEFEPEFTLALSGSARTALSLMAETWGITEAIVPDLSWTYGDVIPKVTAVPLNDDLTISAANIIQAVSTKLDSAEQWRHQGCVILNNPHNTTGKITLVTEIEKILTYCLAHRIRVIDDLSYANMVIAPASERRKIGPVKNCREIANQLIARGVLPLEAIRYLITVRSISKTDCKAGARLCVIEIPDSKLREQLNSMVSTIEPNRMALLLSYLFYRNGIDKIQEFWALRDQIQWERMQALMMGLKEIPPSDNVYGIRLVPPQGAMYPHLVIENLPENVIIADLASKLASKGIGLIPMTTFAHTRYSYAYTTRSFRLTLGGSVSSQLLKKQVGRLVTELTREIQRNAYDYTLYSPELVSSPTNQALINQYATRFLEYWAQIENLAQHMPPSKWRPWDRNEQDTKTEFISHFLPQRKADCYSRLRDRAYLMASLREGFGKDTLQQHILEKFQREISSTTEAQRREHFQQRLFDRTVHPTQSYSIQVEKLFSKLIRAILTDDRSAYPAPGDLFKQLQQEYFGRNIAIRSAQEAEEAILDLDMLALVEDFSDYFYGTELSLTLSLWSDWDGTWRPSGQGHTLVAGALITNVLRLAELVKFLDQQKLLDEIDATVLTELGQIEKKIKKFLGILKKITELTTELEARYRKHVQPIARPNWLVRKLRKLGLARDPIQVMWKHSDRNERRMQAYRRERSSEILRFFKIDHQLRSFIQNLMPEIARNSHHPQLLERLATYKNPLKRFYLTPRIHQKMITASDSFAIDTTVYNLVEINRMGAMFGYPGLVLSLQVSMTNRADAIIRLDKKLREEWDRVVRENPSIQPVHIRIVPLFEEIEILQNIEGFLDEIWEYAEESKVLGQTAQDRFCEIIGEFFVAGSDLSQQVSQPQALILFKQAKTRINTYLLKKGLAGRLRIKFGTGEPAQRQGGYYDPYAAQK
ncbi:MAG: aminotransferase class I/II-fold pyridoxal phosphate-dependent enzyme, partial [candidate division KSB1 bacterium]|nr:aminotransferase class I/II-fold pyridoxal phosphate-dependent enzyme [candidate division KSB1 bacterium]